VIERKREDEPLGIGGRALRDWHLGPAKDHPANRRVISDMLDGMGATIMGRNMFGLFAANGGTRSGGVGGAPSRPTTARCSCLPITHVNPSR
jgi:hypothetical protein